MLHYYVLKFVSCLAVCAWGNDPHTQTFSSKGVSNAIFETWIVFRKTEEASEATEEAKSLL